MKIENWIEENNGKKLDIGLNENMNEFDFFFSCKEKNISIFFGSIEPNDVDILIFGANNFLDFCVVNGIKSIILDMEYDEDVGTEINLDECKNAITRFYERKVDGFPYSYLPMHITKDFYAVILNEVLQDMEIEIQNINSNIKQFEESDDEDRLLSIVAYALHEGSRVYTLVYSIADGEEESDETENAGAEEVTKKGLLDKYARIIAEKLQLREKEAKAESERITKELKETIFKQITEEIKNNKNLVEMKTQKSRNEFADRLYVEWKEDRGNAYDWLTKTAVRSIVEREYFHATKV